MAFSLYWTTERVRELLEALAGTHDSPGGIQHIAFVPSRDRMFVAWTDNGSDFRCDFSAVHAWALHSLQSITDGVCA